MKTKGLLPNIIEFNPQVRKVNFSRRRFTEEQILELFAALKSNAQITSLNLYGTGMNDDRLAQLSQVLPETHILELNLGGNNFTHKGLSHFSTCLAAGKASLQKVNLSFNNIDHLGFNALMPGLSNNKCLTELILSNNPLGSEITGLSRIIITLEKLYLGSTNLGDAGAKLIAEMIKKNNTLKFIDLSFNSFSDNGGSLIAISLRRHSKMEHLSLSGNNLTDATLFEFFYTSRVNSQLNKINLSLIKEIKCDMATIIEHEKLINSHYQCDFFIKKTNNYADINFYMTRLPSVEARLRLTATTLLRFARCLLNVSSNTPFLFCCLPPELQAHIISNLDKHSILNQEQQLAILNFAHDKKTLKKEFDKEKFLNSVGCDIIMKPMISRLIFLKTPHAARPVSDEKSNTVIKESQINI